MYRIRKEYKLLLLLQNMYLLRKLYKKFDLFCLQYLYLQGKVYILLDRLYLYNYQLRMLYKQVFRFQLHHIHLLYKLYILLHFYQQIFLLHQ